MERKTIKILLQIISDVSISDIDCARDTVLLNDLGYFILGIIRKCFSFQVCLYTNEVHTYLLIVACFFLLNF